MTATEPGSLGCHFMANDEIPVTPSLITWARKRAGYSLEEASETFKKIEAWEAGATDPDFADFDRPNPPWVRELSSSLL